MQPECCTIGQLARRAGLPVSTVRFYERERLLLPDTRSHARYRVYGLAALERLRCIRAAHASGFTLKDIALLLDIRDGKTSPCKRVQTLIKRRLSDIRRREAQLSELRMSLQGELRRCKRSERSGHRQLIDRLSATPSGSSPPRRRSSCWMFRYLVNTIFNLNKKTGRRSEVSLTDEVVEVLAAQESPSAPGFPADPESCLEQVSDPVKAAILELPRSQRVVFLLRGVSDLTYREIADLMQTPIGTVMSLLSRARTKLRAELAGLDLEEGLAHG